VELLVDKQIRRRGITKYFARTQVLPNEGLHGSGLSCKLFLRFAIAAGVSVFRLAAAVTDLLFYITASAAVLF
jgi:hypothetical protein